MDNVTSSIITPIVESLIEPVKHLGFCVSSTKNVKNMKRKLEELNFTEKDIRDNWNEAVTKNHVVSHHICPWLDDVKKINEKAGSIPTGGIRWFNIAKRYKTGRDSYNILEEIQALETRKSDIVFTERQIPLAELALASSAGPSTSIAHHTQNNFKSRDLIYKAALESLHPHNESQKMIALCGMGGVGKTTMMEHLKKDAEKLNLFDRVVKVVIGEDTDLIALQRAIAIYINLNDLNEEMNDARADRLRAIFEGMSQQGKKVLIIMDDLWKAFDLKDVGLSPLPNGFKLLITSRFEDVCTHMGVRKKSVFGVRVLNYEEAKSLFFGIVGLSDGDDPALRKIGDDIVKKCGGLPIAVVTMAKSLSDNIEEAWKKALWLLKKDDLEDLESITHRIFEMSYENLKKGEDKAIFLLCGLFPDDFNIPTEDLLRFGWGLGFYKAKTLATARNNLIRANLLTESDNMGCVKMHDLVRAFVLNEVSKVKQASINHDKISEQDAKNSYDRILLKCTGMTEFPVDFSYPNLSMLLLMDGKELLKFPEDIYERMIKLEVMSYKKMHIPMLPIAFEHSIKLRTLSLRSCSFINDDISFLGSLSNLETLCFVDCKLTWLPSTIGKLKKLKILDLTGYGYLRIDDGVFQNLCSLEELYMRANKHCRIRFTDANCGELEILSRKLSTLEFEFFENKVQLQKMSVKNLERFRISVGCRTDMNDKEVDSFRNTIRFVGDYNELLECQINDLFEKTEILYLKVSGMNHLEGHSFSNLKVLDVDNCEELTYLFTVDVASGLKRLERLTISKCPVMRTLVAENSTLEVIIFPKLTFMSLEDLPEMLELRLEGFPMLRKIKVGNCINLVNLFPSNPLPILNHLEELEVRNCGSVEVLFNIDFESFCGIGECKLRRISVNKLGKLKELWRMKGVNKSDIHIDYFKSVESIHIIDCFIFENIFTPTTSIFDLRALTHYDMSNTVGKDNAGKVPEMDEFIPNATSYLLQKCHHLHSLRLTGDRVVGEVLFNMDTQQPLQFSFQNLTYIYLDSCNNLKYLFSPLIAKYLSNLKNIVINSCDSIEEVVSSRGDSKEENTCTSSSSHQNSTLFPHLETLWLSNLPCLNSIDGVDHTRSGMDKNFSKGGQVISGCWSLCQYLACITIFKCNVLSTLIPWYAVGQMKMLQDLTIESCSMMTEVFTFSTLESLTQLKELNVEKCKAIQVIVKEEMGTSSQVVIKFPSLKTLRLDDLPNLKGFFLGVNEFEFPSLDDVFINDCPQLMTFTPGDQSKTPKLKYIQTKFGKYIVESCGLNFHGVINKYQTTLPNCSSSPITLSKEIPWSFYNLIEISIKYDKVSEAIIPSHALQQLQKLEKITILSCEEVEKVFEVELEEINNSGFSESQTTTVVKIPNLTQAYLYDMKDLKYLWKISQWMVLEFPNLTTLTIEFCYKLEHVFTCSMVGSLVQLQDLDISCCDNLEVIVKEEEEKCDAKVNEIIMLPHLKSLKLKKLQSLKGFCIGNDAFSLPTLDYLKIKDCPEITVFTKGELSTPELKVIDTTYGKWYVKPDLNTFIKTKQEKLIRRSRWESTDS